mgnify:CR=1 FL=1|tara:strand:+ start:170 stop:568 length:399 start_codon:yes stop_codon:yes gene_type:complete
MPKKDSSGDKWGDTKFVIFVLILLVWGWGDYIDDLRQPVYEGFKGSPYKWGDLIVLSIISIPMVLALSGYLLSLINYLWDTWQRRHPHNRSLKPLFTAVVLVVAVIVFLYVVVNIYPFVDYLIDKIKTVTHT